MADKVKALRLRDSDRVAIDNAIHMSEIRSAATFTEPRAESLLSNLQRFTGIDSRRWRRLVIPHIGLPADSALLDLLKRSLEGWLPAIVQGYNICKVDDPGFSDIPHTVSVRNRGPSEAGDRWLFKLDVVCGPLSGISIPLSVTPKLAATMLYRTGGLRIFSSLPRLRPYDMHNLDMLAGLQRTNGSLLLRKVCKPSSPRTTNRDKVRAYVGKCRFNPLQQCFDCGRGPSECSNSRHDCVPPTGTCRVCGTDKYRLNPKGACTSCVQRHLKNGTPLVPAQPKPPLPEWTM